jgi:hypothetical protein
VDNVGDVGWFTSLALDDNDYPHISYFDFTNYDLKYARWTGTEWVIETVDSAGNVGLYTSLALDSNGWPHICYLDWDTGDLKYARWTGINWEIETVDSAGGVGLWTSISLDSQDRPHISYQDYGNQDLKYARWTGTGWMIEVVDSAGNVGHHTSIALDSNDYPHIAYQDYQPNYDLKYARWTGSAWVIQTVDQSIANVGEEGISIALDSQDNPHISYPDRSNKCLKYARWTGAEWILETVDTDGVGTWTSIVLDTLDRPHISYHDYVNLDLKYAHVVMLPTAPSLYKPINGEITNDSTPTFEWFRSLDADSHRLLVDNDPGFLSPQINVLLGPADNVYTPSSAFPDGKYYWKVVAVNPAGGSASSEWSFTIDTQAPSPPQLLSPANETVMGDNTPIFMWSDIVEVVKYELEVDNDSDFNSLVLGRTELTSSFYQVLDDEALADENYFWRVRAIDNVGNVGDWSTVWIFEINSSLPSDEIKPPTPSLELPENDTITSDDTPLFDWEEVSDPSGVMYEIQIDGDQDFSPPLEFEKVGLQISEYQLANDEALADGDHFWRVRAIDGVGNVGDWSEIWTLLIDTTTPSAPELLNPPDNSITDDNTPTFTWAAVDDLSGVTYTLQVDNDPDFSSPEIDAPNLTGISYTHWEALADGYYTWRVVVKDGVGNESISEVWTFRISTLGPPIPILLEPVNGTKTNDNAPIFKWMTVDPAISVTYDLQIDNDENFGSPENMVSGLMDNFYVLSAPLPDGNYFWHVRSVSDLGNIGDWSLTWTLLIDTLKPSAPTLMSPTNGTKINDNIPLFDWGDVLDASGVTYRFEIDNDNDFSSPELIKNNLATSQYKVLDNEALADENYFWRVRAFDGAGNVGEWSSVWAVMIDAHPPGIPSLLSPKHGATFDTTPTFDWADVSDPSGVTYLLEIDNGITFDSPNLRKLGLTISEYEVLSHEALPEGTWYWRVRAFDGAGNAGDWSTIWTLIIQTPPPPLPFPIPWALLAVLALAIGAGALMVIAATRYRPAVYMKAPVNWKILPLQLSRLRRAFFLKRLTKAFLTLTPRRKLIGWEVLSIQLSRLRGALSIEHLREALLIRIRPRRLSRWEALPNQLNRLGKATSLERLRKALSR